MILKTPISYYGGKQMMLKHILPLIPEHLIYTEAFAGGAAVYFSKQPSKIEVINDLNSELINFYRVLQTRYDELKKEILCTLHSRKQHRIAFDIYQHPQEHGELTRAWALWVLCNQGFACKIGSSWGYDKSSNSIAKKVQNGKHRFNIGNFKERIELTQIECNDAVKVIQSRDRDEAFHYIDPPYYNSNCGHYSGYTIEDFTKLLDTCQNLKGKFLLSSYPSDILTQYVERNNWSQVEYKKRIAVSKNAKGSKIEVLTANYPIHKVK